MPGGKVEGMGGYEGGDGGVHNLQILPFSTLLGWHHVVLSINTGGNRNGPQWEVVRLTRSHILVHVLGGRFCASLQFSEAEQSPVYLTELHR